MKKGKAFGALYLPLQRHLTHSGPHSKPVINPGASRLWRGQRLAEPASGKGSALMGNVWVDVFIWNSTYGYISEDQFTGAIHPTLGHGDKAGYASCFPGEGAPDDLAPVPSTGCLGFQQSFLHRRQRGNPNTEWMQNI